jgi:AraC-like DNA-binding protein
LQTTANAGYLQNMNASLQLRQWADLQADLAWIYEGDIPAEYTKNQCRPEFLGAWLLLSGSAEVVQAKRRVTATSGQWLILKQAAGVQTFSADARILSLRYRAEWLDRKPFFDIGLPLVINASSAPALEAKARLIHVAVKPLELSSPTDLRIHSIYLEDFIEMRARFWEWFGELHNVLARLDVHPTRTGIHDERIASVLYALDRMSLSSKLWEDELASKAGLSTAHFVKLFSEEVGTTPKRYFDERRRETCRRLLSATNTPIKEIAINLGFLRLSDFSAWFSKGHGLSPRQFREREHKRGGGLRNTL